MSQPLVTVVLPIYNVERYLNRCIESVVGQTYQNIEILLIDDGSPDHCPQMCDEWAKKDSRVRVIHKINQGLGMARNTGIHYATGEYICFFDSDDYVTSDAIEKLVAKALKEHAEVVLFGFSAIACDGEVATVFKPGTDRAYRGRAVQEEFLPDLVAPDPYKNSTRLFYMSACMMMYSMDVVRRSGWQFVSERDIISEDVYSLLNLMQYVNSVTALPEALYCYCENGASLSRSYQPGRYKKIKHFYAEATALCEKSGYVPEVSYRLADPFLSFTLAALKQEVTAPRSVGERMECLRQIIGDPLLQHILRQNRKDHVSGTRRIMYICMRYKLYWVCFCLLKIKK